MEDYYLDDIYMHGAAAKDIPYFSIQNKLPETTSKDTPIQLYDRINAETKEKYSTDNPAYQDVKKELVRTAKKAGLPLKIYLLAVAGLACFFLILATIHDGFDFRTVLFAILAPLILTVVPGIAALIYGAVIRNRPRFKDLERAYSSEIHVLNDNSIAIIKHCYDYPKYDKFINPSGQLMSITAGFTFDFNNPVSDEMQKIEEAYEAGQDGELPFSQVYLIKSIKQIDSQKGLLVLSADCDVYTILHPIIGTVTRANGTIDAFSSSWYTCHYGADKDVRLVLPAVKRSIFKRAE